MNYLAINTSGKYLELICQYDGNLVTHRDSSPLKHSVTMMPAIEKIMQDKNWDELDYLAVNIGPGSFTGIRIGVTAIKSFAYIKNKKIICYDTLQMFASSIDSSNTDTIISIANGGNNNYYVGAYNNEGGYIQEVMPPCAMTKDELNLFLSEITEDALIATDCEDLAFYNNFKVFIIDDSTKGAIKIISSQRAKIVDYNALTPLYIQVSQAERNI